MIEVTCSAPAVPIVDPHRAGPSTLVRAGDQTFLVDCGRGVLMRAAAVGVGAANLTALLLTHLHSDHITDLSDVITTRWVTTFTRTPAAGHRPAGHRRRRRRDARRAGSRHRLPHRPPRRHHRTARRSRCTSSPTASCGTTAVSPSWRRRPTTARSSRRSASVSNTTARRWSWPATPFRATSLDALAAGADALVHTVIRKDLVERCPPQRIRDILDYHSSVQEAAATAARAGVGTLVLTHYVPPLAPGQEERVARTGGHGVRRADRAGRRPAPGRGTSGGAALGGRTAQTWPGETPARSMNSRTAALGAPERTSASPTRTTSAPQR